MAKKAELEFANTLYFDALSRSRTLVDAADLPAAIQAAQAGWTHITQMLQYTRSIGGETTSIELIELVIRYAPVVFDRAAIDAAAHLLRTQKSILKNDSSGLPERIAAAREQLDLASRVWARLQVEPRFMQSNLRQTFGGDQEWLRWLAETWEQQGFVNRQAEGRSYRLSVSVDFDEPAHAKCPACGVVASARRHRLWEDRVCPGCSKQVSFVLL